MFKNILNTLTCPYCRSKLELDQVLTENRERIINGIVKCECRRYPIVEGILVLRIDEQLDYTIKLLKKEKNYDALLTLLKSGRDRKLSSLLQLQKANIPFFNFFNKLFLYYKRIIFRSFFKNKKMTFCQTVDTWKYGLWGDYLKHRFSNPTFLVNLPLINMIKEPEKNVLDLGCGTGHTSFVISKFVPERNIICADREFVNLFLAKTFFVNDGTFICLDGNAPLPFNNNFFYAILCADVLHSLDSKHLMVNECKRIVDPEGILLFSHLHSSLKYNPYSRSPLSPRGYANLFDGFELKVLPEESLLGEYLFDDKLDLTKDFNKEEINNSSVIDIIATKNKKHFNVYNNIFNSVFKSTDKLIINPLYKVNKEKEKIVLIRKFPSDTYEEEYSFSKKYMPEKHVIEKNIFDAIQRNEIIPTKNNEVRTMLRKFILLDTPKKYI